MPALCSFRFLISTCLTGHIFIVTIGYTSWRFAN